ncbi:hypothetical protein Tsubulata_022613 [Turnera subulata]|uniref:WLM domain-containing protein n=1 Tax=Turnera subulata TaxID=218843 RepID=A0A9Q0FBW1_9ROSI|nr:hypothetical protein Tsubulata_022613 [Turnera subulata]
MNSGDLHKVWEIKALKRKPGHEEAQKMLDKIALQVQPIMRKHKWRVKVLSEFCPNNPALLGLNVGAGIHVKLRLRRANRDWDFIPFDQVLDTMLHELCHNAHGPHNANFYKLWDELRRECEELISKGISGTGQGFDLPGRRLGGFSRQPPVSSLRKTALAAAEKRAKLGSMLPSQPQRLGGNKTIMGALTPVQAAAMAAERRLQDEIWCASLSAAVFDDEENCSDLSGDLENAPKQVTEASKPCNGRKRSCESKDNTFFPSSTPHSGINFVDLSADASTSGSVFGTGSSPRKQNCNLYKNSSSNSSQRDAIFVDLTCDSTNGLIPNDETLHERKDSAMWECAVCTLLNPPLALICEACSTKKPNDASSKYKLWTCKFCTLENSVELDKCLACDQWRYSYGEPVSARAPNVGT